MPARELALPQDERVSKGNRREDTGPGRGTDERADRQQPLPGTSGRRNLGSRIGRGAHAPRSLPKGTTLRGTREGRPALKRTPPGRVRPPHPGGRSTCRRPWAGEGYRGVSQIPVAQ